MAGQIFLRVGSAKPRVASAAFPQLIIKDGTNFPAEYLAFDASTEETTYLTFKLPSDYTTNTTFTVKLMWNAATATSGVVRWGVSLAAYTPDTDTGSWEAKGFATEATVDDTHLGTNALQIMTCSASLTSGGSNLDSAAAGDVCVLRIARKAAHANDTMTGDANLLEHLEISW